MARPRAGGPLRVYSQLGDPELASRVAAQGLVLVDDPADAEAILREGKTATDGTEAPEALSAREAEILEYVADGWSTEEIADRLGIRAATVKFHLGGVYRKFGVNRRTEAVREGLRRGIVEI